MIQEFFKEHPYLKLIIQYDEMFRGWMITVYDTRNDGKLVNIIRDSDLQVGLEDWETAIMIPIIRTFGEEEGTKDD